MEPSPPTSYDQEEKNARKKATDRALESSTSDASMDMILKTANIEIEDIQGRVLELGSGTNEQFTNQLREEGKDVTVINPKLAYEHASKRRLDYANPETSAVAAIAQELPFKSESFDTIIVSAVLHLIQKKDYDKALSEIYRVLSPKGRAYILPLYNDEGWRSTYTRPFTENCLLEMEIPFTLIESSMPNGMLCDVIVLEKP